MRFIKSISLMILVIFSITNINYANAAEIITDDEQYNNLTELLDNYQEENPTGDLAVEKEINVSDISIVPEYEPSDNEISTFSFSIINSNGRNTITTRDYARQQLGDGTRLQAAYDTVLSYLEDVHNDNVDFDSYYDGIKQDADRRNVEVYLLKSLNMTSFGIDRTELKKVVDSVKYDHPEFFWLSSSFFYCGYLDSFTQQGLVWIPVVPKNYCTRKMRSDMREKIDEAMDEYRGLISDDMSDYEKEKIIHDKIINDTVYDPNLNRANESINDHNIAGVFIDHVAVCEGYARAMQILLNEACIDNIYVVGRSHNEGHAWNQVKIGDSYYNLDSTWDDTGDNKYRYFNVPDSLFDDHTAFTTSSSQYLYNIKSCNSNSAYNYLSSDDVDYFFNIDSTDVGELTNDNMKLFLNAKLKDALNNNKFDIIFMCQDEPMCQSLYSYYKNNTNTSSNPQRTIFDSELSQKIVDLSGHFPNVSSYGKMLRFKFTPKSDYETKIQSITIPDEINLDSKDSYFINQLIAPINANNKNLTWRSSNEGVVRIYNGILSPIASGDSLITCTSTDGSSITSNTCTVHVSIVNKPVESIELPEREITLSNIGETKKIQAIVNPSDASNGVLQWTSSNDRINVSDNGTVTACTNGNIQSTITCKTTDGTNISKSCIVKINYDGTRDYIDTITMNQDHINLSVNSTKNLRDNIELNSSIDPNTAPLKWASSDYNIAQIDEDTGEIKGISEGEATITCTANDRVTGSDSEGWRRVSASCTVNVVRNEDNVLVNSITVSPESVTLTALGETKTLTKTIEPDNATDTSVRWTSSDTGVATVTQSGVVKAMANGTAVITCKAKDGSEKTGQCTITVDIPESSESTDVKVNSITVSPASVTLTSSGETKNLAATIEPSNATDTSVNWTSSNIGVATVTQSGVVTAVSNGTSVITCKAQDGSNKTGQCTVTVNIPESGGDTDIKVSSVTVSPESATLTSAGETKNLTATIEPSNATDTSVNWTSSDTGVATVTQSGVVRAVSNGTAVITCKAQDGSNKTGQCTITVDIPEASGSTNIRVNSVTVSPGSATITSAGGTKNLAVTIGPSNATDKSVNWISSDTGVATVTQSGVVTAVSNGTAVITCKAQDGSNKTGQCTITVNISQASGSTDIKVNSITVSPASSTLTSAGETKNLAVTIGPSNATDKSVKWTSSDTGVATVTQSGVVTAVSNGTAVITCEAQDGSRVKSTCTVTVGISQSTGTIAKCSITGTERVGKILRVQVKDSDGKVVKKDLNYKWYRLDDKDSTTGKEVEDESSYKVKSSDKGEYIKVVVTDSSGNEVQDITGKIKKREVDDDDDDDDNNSSNSSLSTGNNSNTNTNNSINNVNSNVNNTASGYVQSQNQNGSWQQINGTWRLIQTGSQTGNQQISSQSITSGSYKWQQLNGKWYLSDSSNHKLTGWQKVDNSWYLIGPSGDMATGWQIVSGKWYYLKENGQMTTGWQDVNGSWYYMNSDGSMATNTTIDGYRLNDRGQVVY